LRHRLAGALRGNVLIVGVGNTDRGDDGAGPLLIRLLEGRVGAQCLDAGVAPENFLEVIVRATPDTVLLIDAADFGGAPGEVGFYAAADIDAGGLSTHALSLSMMCGYLQARSPVRVWLLAIQPEQTDNDRLSDAVAGALQELADLVAELIPAGRASPACGTPSDRREKTNGSSV